MVRRKGVPIINGSLHLSTMFTNLTVYSLRQYDLIVAPQDNAPLTLGVLFTIKLGTRYSAEKNISSIGTPRCSPFACTFFGTLHLYRYYKR